MPAVRFRVGSLRDLSVIQFACNTQKLHRSESRKYLAYIKNYRKRIFEKNQELNWLDFVKLQREKEMRFIALFLTYFDKTSGAQDRLITIYFWNKLMLSTSRS
jgi:hypothetical protein